MMHKKRRWCLAEVASTDELARLLTQQTWTLCTGFWVRGHEAYLFLNDSTSENGAQEYGIVKRSITGGNSFVQLESITFSWCAFDLALAYVQAALAGMMDDDMPRPVSLQLERAEEHRRCHLCT